MRPRRRRFQSGSVAPLSSAQQQEIVSERIQHLRASVSPRTTRINNRTDAVLRSGDLLPDESPETKVSSTLEETQMILDELRKNATRARESASQSLARVMETRHAIKYAATAVEDDESTANYDSNPTDRRHSPLFTESARVTGVFSPGSLSARFCAKGTRRGMHGYVCNKIEQAQHDAEASLGDGSFGQESFLSTLRLGKGGFVTPQRRKFKQIPLSSLQHEPHPPPRDRNEILRRKAEIDSRWRDEMAMKLSIKEEQSTSTGANAKYCAKMWLSWIVLIRCSSLFAEAIASRWEPFDEVKRQRALYHPPKGFARIAALTRAANAIARQYRTRKASRRLHQSTSILQEWALKFVKKMKLKVAVHQYTSKVRKIQRWYRAILAERQTRPILWANMWTVHEKQILRYAELSVDSDVQEAVAQQRLKESGKALYQPGQAVGPHLTPQQRKEKAMVKRRVEDFFSFEKDTLLQSMVSDFVACEHLQPATFQVAVRQMRDEFLILQSRRLEEFRKRARVVKSRKEYLLEYCRAARVRLSEVPPDMINTDPLPTVHSMPRYPRRQALLDRILSVQRENRKPIVVEPEPIFVTEVSGDLSRGRTNSIRRKSSLTRISRGNSMISRRRSVSVTASSPM